MKKNLAPKTGSVTNCVPCAVDSDLSSQSLPRVEEGGSVYRRSTGFGKFGRNSDGRQNRSVLRVFRGEDFTADDVDIGFGGFRGC